MERYCARQGVGAEQASICCPRALASFVGPLFLILSTIMVSIIVGWFRRKRWAWWLAIGVLGNQIIADIINLVHRDLLRGSAGFVIASALLFLLIQREVREQFF